MTPQATAAETLTTTEADELTRCQKIVSKGLKGFLEVGQALLIIRDKRLYRGEHKTFEQYLKRRWGIVRSRGYRLIDAFKIAEDLGGRVETASATVLDAKVIVSRKLVEVPPGRTGASTNVDVRPEREAQCRPLASLPAAQRREAFDKAFSDAGGKQPTMR
jgi:hypothetical protein